MSTLDAHRELAVASGLTVHDAHRAVRDARLIHCQHGRARTAHWGRQARHLQVSQYRAAVSGATRESPSTRREDDIQPNRRAVLTILTVTCAVGLLYLGVLRVFEPASSGWLILLGVYLIAVGGAVLLNAITVEAMNQPPPDPRPLTPSR